MKFCNSTFIYFIFNYLLYKLSLLKQKKNYKKLRFFLIFKGISPLKINIKNFPDDLNHMRCT